MGRKTKSNRGKINCDPGDAGDTKGRKSLLRELLAGSPIFVAVAIVAAAMITSRASNRSVAPHDQYAWLNQLNLESEARDIIGFNRTAEPSEPDVVSVVTAVLEFARDNVQSRGQHYLELATGLASGALSNHWEALIESLTRENPATWGMSAEESMGAAYLLLNSRYQQDDILPFTAHARVMTNDSSDAIVSEASVLIGTGSPNKAIKLLDEHEASLYQASIGHSFALHFLRGQAFGSLSDNDASRGHYELAYQTVDGAPGQEHNVTVARLSLIDAYVAAIQVPGAASRASELLTEHDAAVRRFPTPHPFEARGHAVWARYLSTGKDMEHYDTAAAAERAERAIDLYRQLGNESGLALCARLQARIALGNGEYDKAVAYYQLESESWGPMRIYKAFAILNKGIALEILALESVDRDKALDCMQKALDAAEQAIGILIGEQASPSSIERARMMAAARRDWIETQVAMSNDVSPRHEG
jgi:tetratricopeptide (TPR) repeat protein